MCVISFRVAIQNSPGRKLTGWRIGVEEIGADQGVKRTPSKRNASLTPPSQRYPSLVCEIQYGVVGKNPSCIRHAVCAYWVRRLFGSNARAALNVSHSDNRQSRNDRATWKSRALELHMARGKVKSIWATMALRILPNLTSSGCHPALADRIPRSWWDWLELRSV